MTTLPGAPNVNTDDHVTYAQPVDAADPLQSLLSSVEPVAVTLDFVGATLEDYDRLIRAMDLATDGAALPGCLFHWARSTLDGLRLCEVWRNRTLFEFFQREEAIPTYRRLHLPEPELSFYRVHNYLTSADLLD